MLRLVTALVSTSCLLTSHATAADVAVRYLAERAPLRAAAPTALVRVELHPDPGCSAPIAATTVALGALDAVTAVERVKLRGAHAGPRLVELRHVVHGVPAVPAVYARITGDGVAPATGDCQLQAIAAPPGAAWPLVRDADGAPMGAVAIVTSYGGNGVIADDGHGAYAIAYGRHALAAVDYYLSYATPDCSGTPYLALGWNAIVGSSSVEGVIWVPSGPLATTPLAGFYDDRCSGFDPEPYLAAPAMPFDPERFAEPYAIDLGGAQ